MDARAERIGRNEALFRQVNERLRELGESFSLVAEHADFVCECGDDSCVQPLEVSISDYERVRSDPRWFLLAPGHETANVEAVVERHDGWIVVEKRSGAPTRLAVENDPRN
jgi:hypothetical protein